MVVVSDLADAAVLLPLSVLIALLLGVAGWFRPMLAWSAAVAASTGTTVLLKACSVAIAPELIRPFSPSGHVAFATMVYGGLAVLLLRPVVPAPLLTLPPALVAGVVGWSRIMLGAHTLAEVLAGAALGGAGVVVAVRGAGSPSRIVLWPVMAGTACTVLAFYGLHLSAEDAIRSAFASD